MTNDNPAKGWYWELSDGEGTHNCCLELYDQQGQMLAFIKPRPPYCDRGHFQVCLEARGLNLDEMDGRGLMYYMDLEVAMWETVEFLVWRIYKISYQHPKGGIKAFAAEEMPAGALAITNVEHRSTYAPHLTKKTIKKAKTLFSRDDKEIPADDASHMQGIVDHHIESLRKLLDQDFVACEKRFYQYVFMKADGAHVIVDQEEARAYGVLDELNAAIERTMPDKPRMHWNPPTTRSQERH